jgi:hypothetical protein
MASIVARLEQADIVLDASPVEGRVFVPVADTHHLPQVPMLLGQVLQFVVVEIAAQSHGREHQNLPVVHSFTAHIVTRILVDILRNQIENRISRFRLAVNVLQRGQNGNNFIAAFQIELHAKHTSTIEPLLAGERFSHPCTPRR